MSRGVIDLGLERVFKTLNKLGDPQEKLRLVHVAGTNGKGSVCAFTASILSHRYRGKFCVTSPPNLKWVNLCHLTWSPLVILSLSMEHL